MSHPSFLTIDGSHGEGGGQILRTSVSLAAIIGRPVEIVNIRAGRTPSGLKAQHVAAVRAAGAICAAMVEGAEVGSERLSFLPGAPVQPGEYRFEVGTAGAATLVLQTVLLLLALYASEEEAGESVVRIVGGTHVPHSPTAEYIAEVYLPALAVLGVTAGIEMKQAGFFPRGGGLLEARIAPGQALRPISASRARAKLEKVESYIVAANLPEHVLERGVNAIGERLRQGNIDRGKVSFVSSQPQSIQPGAAVTLVAQAGEGVRAGFCALGERGVPIERVGAVACEQLLRWHKEGVAQCDEHLADQLALPAALTPGEHSWTTDHATEHLRTALWTAQQFFPGIEYEIAPTKSGGALVEVNTPAI